MNLFTLFKNSLQKIWSFKFKKLCKSKKFDRPSSSFRLCISCFFAFLRFLLWKYIKHNEKKYLSFHGFTDLHPSIMLQGKTLRAMPENWDPSRLKRTPPLLEFLSLPNRFWTDSTIAALQICSVSYWQD